MPGPIPIMVKAFAPHADFDPGRPSIGVASSTPSALGSTRRGRMPKHSGSPGAWSGCSRGRYSPAGLPLFAPGPCFEAGNASVKRAAVFGTMGPRPRYLRISGRR